MKQNGQDPTAESSGDTSLFSRFRKVPGDVKLLIEKRMELWALQIGELITGMIADTVYRIMGLAMLVVSGLLLLIALASFVGELVDNESLGYVIVAAPFLLLGILFANKRPKFVIARTQQQMMDQFYANMEKKKSEMQVDAETDTLGHDSERDQSSEKTNQ